MVDYVKWPDIMKNDVEIQPNMRNAPKIRRSPFDLQEKKFPKSDIKF